MTGTSPPSPHIRGTNVHPRPISPHPLHSHSESPPSATDRSRPIGLESTPLFDKFGNVIPPPPPPPPISSLPEENSTPTPSNGYSLTFHGRSGSADQVEHDVLPKNSNQQPNATVKHGSKSRDPHGKQRPRNRSTKSDYEDNIDFVAKRKVKDDSDGRRASPVQRIKVKNSSSSRSSPHRLPIPAPPSKAPPPVPTADPQRIISPASSSRGARTPVPANWTVTWKGEDNPKVLKAPSSSNLRNLKKTVKSMENLRSTHHPVLPSSRPPPPRLHLPVAGTSVFSSSSGLPKTYEPASITRVLPMHNGTGTLGPGSLDYSQYASYGSRPPGYGTVIPSPSAQDPVPRPVSASGEQATSPKRRQNQSPIYGGSLDPSDGLYMPRSSSPIDPLGPSTGRYGRYDSAIGTGPRPVLSPRHHSREKGYGRSENSSSTEGSNDTMHAMDSTLTKDTQAHIWKMLESSGSGTVMPGRALPTDSPQTPYSEVSYDDWESGGEGGGTWIKPPTSGRSQKTSLRGPPLTLRIESPKVSQATPSTGSALTATASTTVRRAPSSSLLSGQSRQSPQPRTRPRGRTIIEPDSRPPPEEMYERLEEFFPEHDLDRPVIEAISGGTSPTTADIPPVTPAPISPTHSIDSVRVRSKKSIRHVAEEHKKRIDRTSRGSAMSAMMRKRSTKLWGSKLEEVTTANGRVTTPGTESPSSSSCMLYHGLLDFVLTVYLAPATFKWIRGELIGRGTYGKVYLALNATTGEMIAVKQVETLRTALDRSDSRQVTVVQALKLESETLKDLDHPNIVQYLGFEETLTNLSM
jgi:hypothetical protein